MCQSLTESKAPSTCPWAVRTSMGKMTPRAITSQASFDPPGFTVAVKRDRAAEALLLAGAKFVVNIIAEGAEKVRQAHKSNAETALPQGVCMPFARGSTYSVVSLVHCLAPGRPSALSMLSTIRLSCFVPVQWFC